MFRQRTALEHENVYLTLQDSTISQGSSRKDSENSDILVCDAASLGEFRKTIVTTHSGSRSPTSTYGYITNTAQLVAASKKAALFRHKRVIF
jgi:hypothetical protein